MTIVRQHFVPACYLSFFTKERKRDGVLYVIDYQKSPSWRESSPDSECVEKDFYKKNLQDNEDKHQVFENSYSKLAEIAIGGKKITANIQIRIVAFMVQMYVRNPSILHNEGVNRMDLFEKDFDNIMESVASSTGMRIKTPKDAFVAIANGWLVRVVENKVGSWMTSDNPCAIYRAKNTEITMMTMPLSPKHFCVAVNQKYFRFTTTAINKWDGVLLHSAIYGQRRRFGFSINPGDLKGAPGFKIDQQLRGFTDLDKLIGTMTIYPACPKIKNRYKTGFSFLRIVRCPC